MFVGGRVISQQLEATVMVKGIFDFLYSLSTQQIKALSSASRAICFMPVPLFFPSFFFFN